MAAIAPFTLSTLVFTITTPDVCGHILCLFSAAYHRRCYRNFLGSTVWRIQLTMTSPNMLSVFSGDLATGHITFVVAIATGGNGTGVQSQDAVTVFGNYIFAVNPLSNSLSFLWINPQDPTIVKLVGTPVNTQGDFPDTVTASKFTHSISKTHYTNLSPDAQAACAANTGANSGIACFTYNATTGLTLVPSSVQAFGTHHATRQSPGTRTNLLHPQQHRLGACGEGS